MVLQLSNDYLIILMKQGIAYKARLVFEDIGEGGGNSENTKLRIPRQIVNLIDLVYSCGAKIHSASWGTYINAYTSDTASIDQFMQDESELAGNHITIEIITSILKEQSDESMMIKE